MSVTDIALLALFGGLGATARFLVGAVVPTSFPVGTWIVNILGSFALGLLTGLASDGTLTGNWLLILGVGFCGGFTTFSTASVDTVQLWDRGHRRRSISNVVMLALICLVAAGRGFYITSNF